MKLCRFLKTDRTSEKESVDMTVNWYELVNGGELRQCDILRGVIIPQVSGLNTINQVRQAYEDPVSHQVAADLNMADLMILTQSCDLEKEGQQESVLTALISPWHPTYTNKTKKDRLSLQKQVQRGSTNSMCLLSAREEKPGMDWSVVDFRSLHTLPRKYIQEHAIDQGDRLRLASPYREHISQAFARFFMRVALVNNLSEFAGWDPPIVT